MNSIYSEPGVSGKLLLYRYRILKRNRFAYWLLLLLITASILALPWIYVESVISSPGVITPLEEPIEIRAEASGKLFSSHLNDNYYVQQGDSLFSIRTGLMRKELFILAPISGYVCWLHEFEGSSVVKKGQRILEIVPKSALVVKCYLSGKDITSVQPEQSVEFQVESPKKNLNAVYPGTITEIVPSINMNEGRVIYEVRCSIADFQKEIHPRELKPGITLLTRFRLARRSAFDIILKDVEDENSDQS
jgi:multidrug resistance efflux pump